MRILLVQPPLDRTTSKLSAIGLAEPLGLEYLAGAVPDHDVRILDLRVGGSLVEEMEHFRPELVGVTAMTATLSQALHFLKMAKDLDPRVLTVIGGVHATLRPEDCQVPQMDVIVQGEGENTLAEIAARIEPGESLADVTGIQFREDGQWRTTPPRILPALDDLPLPARHLTLAQRDRYSRAGVGQLVSLVSSRGCSRRCTFCSVWRLHGGKYRTRSPENLVAEIATRPEEVIDFVDDDSFGNVRRMEELRKRLHLEVPGKSYRAFVRADTVVEAPELFAGWAEEGLRSLFIGLESFNDQELRDAKKSATAADNAEALAILQRLGIGVIGYLIVRPEYVHEDFQRLSDTVRALPIDQPMFTTLTPFPGTTLYEETKERLVTRNWDHFDGFRSVLPTALPRREFYHQLANLYRSAYSRPRVPGHAAETGFFETIALAIEGIEDE
jgi:radical SAM superfamily enzyme YgiQ (UPF0313 family)